MYSIVVYQNYSLEKLQQKKKNNIQDEIWKDFSINIQNEI